MWCGMTVTAYVPEAGKLDQQIAPGELGAPRCCDAIAESCQQQSADPACLPAPGILGFCTHIQCSMHITECSLHITQCLLMPQQLQMEHEILLRLVGM